MWLAEAFVLLLLFNGGEKPVILVLGYIRNFFWPDMKFELCDPVIKQSKFEF